MKNKTKLWRRNARKLNLQAGQKHQGRKWKYLNYIDAGKLGAYPLLEKLLRKASLWNTMNKTEEGSGYA